jgi:ribonuclease Z
MKVGLFREFGVTVALLAAASVPAQAQQIRVTLLGTGCPPASMSRFGPSTLVEAGDQKLLFDAGRVALQRLTTIQVPWQSVTGVFLTHLHSDHVVGFPDLWLTGWLVGAGRNVPLQVFGPRGTTNMMSHLEKAYEADIQFRLGNNEHNSSEGVVLLAHEIHGGIVYEKDGVKVSAFEVDHGPVKPAFGYRVEFGGRSVALSGDTRPSEALIQHAQGVDVLIHEVFVPETLEGAAISPDAAKRVLALHTTPEQAGAVFSRAKPKLAVYSHICLPTATATELIPATRKTYAGPLEVGEDLMVIDVDEQVRVRRPGNASRP